MRQAVLRASGLRCDRANCQQNAEDSGYTNRVEITEHAERAFDAERAAHALNAENAERA